MMRAVAMRVPAWLTPRHARLAFRGIGLVTLVTTVVVASGSARGSERDPARAARVARGGEAELVNVPASLPRRDPAASAASAGSFVLDDSLFGRSGAVRVRLVATDDAEQVAGLARTFGERAVREPGVLGFATSDDPEAFAFVMMRPWREKRGAYVGAYHLGWWPSEMTLAREERPEGFVEVTPETAALRLSTHFRLADFVTHDQASVWPKYVVLREALLDKLELVLADLAERGVPVGRVTVLSGFRSPQYNARGAAEGAMARSSRHQYGDAADLVIDDDGDGRMDDLNRDGRVDLADTEVLLRAVERVEARYPELVGGLGLYHAMGPSGPFAHIDVRGTRARWLDFGRHRSAPRAAVRTSWAAAPRRIRGCDAEGEMAVLCARR